MKSLSSVLMLSSLVQAAETPLAGFAAAMPERTWVKLTPNTSLNNLDIPYALLYWADSGGWDPIRKMLKWVGATGSCCGDGQYRLVTYSEPTDAWSVALTPYAKSGHSFDGNTVDPSTGDLYFTLYNDKQIKKWNGTAWSELPETPYGACPSMAVAWFPGINGGKGGLVHVGESNQMAWFDGAKWTRITGGQWGSYNLFAEYNPVEEVVWFGAGNGSESTNYKLDQNLALTKLPDAPLSLNVGKSLKSTDPASGRHLVTDLATNDFWEFDVAGTGKWTQLTNLGGTVPDFGDGRPVMQTPIPGHGVIMYLKHNYAQRDVYLYKHAKSVVGVREGLAPRRGPTFDLAYDFSGAGLRISLAGSGPMPAHGATRLEIFTLGGSRIFGRTVGAAELKAGVHWRAGNDCRGQYVLRASSAGEASKLAYFRGGRHPPGHRLVLLKSKVE